MAIAFLCLAFAFLLSVGLTPLVRRAVLHLGWVDTAGRSHRKVHANDIPRLGGIAIVLGFFIPLVAVAIWRPDVLDQLFNADRDLAIAFFVGAAAIAGLGIYDDILGSTAKQKLFVQLLVATALVAAGFKIERLDLPFLKAIDLGLAAYPLTVLWIVGVTNAVNLIDGLDGLAAGVSLIAILPVAAVALVGGQVVLAIVALCLIGAIAGFLVHNFHPAKIFMGDTGSMFLGFVLAVVTVQITQKVSIAASLGAPMLALALPILDTLTAMGRRSLLGKPVFSPDREHFHHRLLRLGLSHRSVVLVMYAAGLAFSGLATVLLLYRGWASGVALIASATLTVLVLYRLGYFGRYDSLTAAIEDAMVMRRRNRAMYAELSSFKRLVRSSDSLDRVAERLLVVAEAAGARWARISLPTLATLQEKGVRVLTPTEFLIANGTGRIIGILACDWPNQRVDGAALHVIESARDILEKRLEKFGSSATDTMAA